MGAKPKKTGSAAKVPAMKKRAPARRVPARKAASKTGRKARDKTVDTHVDTVDAYVGALEGEQSDAARRVRELIASAAPSAAELIKWGQPVYEENGPVVYFKASEDQITVGFWRGSELDDPDGRLEGDDDRMKSFSIRSADEIDEEGLSDWVRQAVDLNRRFGNPTRAESRSGDDGDEGQESRADDDDDDGAYADMAQEIEPAQVETVAPVEGVEDQATQRYQDGSFRPNWDDDDDDN